VVRLAELYNIVIPHFNNYPIFCAKYHAFKLFSEIVTALFNKEKRSIQERRELLKLALSMNITTNRKIETIDKLFTILGVVEEASEFIAQRNKEIIAKILLLNSENFIVSNNFISGFIDGDGSFFISFQRNGEIKTGFNITNDLFSKPLLEIVKQKLGKIGSIREGTKKELVYTVTFALVFILID
jgi:LAGLIDADG endonuclease